MAVSRDLGELKQLRRAQHAANGRCLPKPSSWTHLHDQSCSLWIICIKAPARRRVWKQQFCLWRWSVSSSLVAFAVWVSPVTCCYGRKPSFLILDWFQLCLSFLHLNISAFCKRGLVKRIPHPYALDARN